MTRPIFDIGAFERFLKRIESAGLPVVAGVLPFESARHAEFIANEVPGTSVPDELVERMRRARPDEAAAEGVAIARETCPWAARSRAGAADFDHIRARLTPALAVRR